MITFTPACRQRASGLHVPEGPVAGLRLPYADR
jgi:hypothetical protein